ncbi:MAG: hypothetical protein ACYSUF_12995 [Planctomycetota bacterium]
MWKAILGVIVGYVVIFVWVMVTMAVALMVLDRSFVYEQGTLEVTGGGFVTAVIAPSPRRTPVKVLAGILLVLGLAIAVLHVFVDDPTAEPPKPVAEMNMFEAASESIAPTWYNFAIPVVGCVGVLIGGGLKRRPIAWERAGHPVYWTRVSSFETVGRWPYVPGARPGGNNTQKGWIRHAQPKTGMVCSCWGSRDRRPGAAGGARRLGGSARGRRRTADRRVSRRLPRATPSGEPLTGGAA